MKRKIFIIILTIILISSGMLGSVAAAKRVNNPHGKANVSHLYLFEKDPTTWEIIDHGAWGKMKYLRSGLEFTFNFNGHGLTPELEYSLIYYPDPWPGPGIILLGEGITDIYGDIKIKGSVIVEDLPLEHDYNYPDGAKIWLVLSNDVDSISRCMIGWNPTLYLFEYDLIRFDSLWGGR